MSVPSVALLAALAVLSVPVLAQQASEPAAAASSAMAGDCVKAPARHDHGAERNVPTPHKPCSPAAQADTQRTQKPVPGHDHGKVHKNQ